MKNAMTRRSFLRTASAGAVGIALAACARPAAAPETKQEAPQAEAPAAPEATSAPTTGKTKISIFNYDPTGTDAWVIADKEFDAYFAKKYPNVEVKMDQAPWTGFTEKLLTSIAGGGKYDVIYGYWEWLPQFIENKVVGPLDDMIKGDAEIKADDFFDFAKEMVDGKIYGVGWFVSGWLHWINRNMVKEKGYTDPLDMNKDGKWDYDAWYQFAKDFTVEKDGKPHFGYDMSSLRSLSVYSMIAWANGTDLWDSGFTTSTVNSAENATLWEWVQQFYKEGITPMPGTGTEDNPVGYTNGLVAATMAGQWFTRTIVQDKAPDLFEIGMVPFPKGPKGQYSVAAMNSFYFGQSPENPNEAWSWYKERSFSEEATKLYAQIGGGRFPSRKTVSPFVVYDWEDVSVYDMIRPTLRGYLVSPKESEFNQLWGAAWDEMVLATRPIKEILDQLAEESTALLKK